MTTKHSRTWSVGLAAMLVVGAALVASVAQAEGCGCGARDAQGSAPRVGLSLGARDWHGSVPRVGLLFGAPSGFQDPWFVHPLDPWHAADGLYLSVNRSPAPRAACQSAYALGRSDALSNRPQSCATAKAPAQCCASYSAAYARSLLEQSRRAMLER